ncbi:unnamed protein product [Haemonchus placei]|uniref:PPM-type phosphatase domain-containing protein n=1 Tax=Haemonchus placei TaxID=6290 RepID=A0A0N4WNR8_HAEPC|nr:unnamed protein product [Haemonchus placei]
MHGVDGSREEMRVKTDLNGGLIIVADRFAAVSDREHPGDAVHAGCIRAVRSSILPGTRDTDPPTGAGRGGVIDV